MQVLGVYDPNLTGVIACVLRNLGTQRAMVVHGSDGLDEITHTGRTRISELNGDQIRTYYLEPAGPRHSPGVAGGDRGRRRRG